MLITKPLLFSLKKELVRVNKKLLGAPGRTTRSNVSLLGARKKELVKGQLIVDKFV